MMMRILTANGWTKSQWLSLPEDERLERMAWDTYIQREIHVAHERIIADTNRPQSEDEGIAKLTGTSPEVYTLLRLAELR